MSIGKSSLVVVEEDSGRRLIRVRVLALHRQAETASKVGHFWLLLNWLLRAEMWVRERKIEV